MAFEIAPRNACSKSCLSEQGGIVAPQQEEIRKKNHDLFRLKNNDKLLSQ
jgi:hypothetical protein